MPETSIVITATDHFSAAMKTMRDAIAKTILEGKQLTFEEARRNLSLVAKEASNVEKQMLKTGKAFSKTENTATGGMSGARTLLSGLANSGIANMVNNLM